MESTKNGFPYAPLDPAVTHEIRLLMILPSSDNGADIECQLSHANAETTKYTTLSYEWGDPKVTVPIRLDGQVFQVTTNLEACLHVVRSALVSDIKLWIDAICIDQRNGQERCQQVSMMSKIYQSASFSIAWLGVAQKPCTLALQVLQHDFATADMARSKEMSAILDKFDNAQLAEFLNDYLYLQKLSIWKRIWIVQEICLAKEILIFYGSRLVRLTAWNALLSFLQLNKYPRVDLTDAVQRRSIKISPGTRLWSMRLNYRYLTTKLSRAGLPFGDTLQYLAGEWKASDARDYLYGLIGIIGDLPPVELDYSCEAVDVFSDFTFSLIMHHSSLAILNTPVYSEEAKIIGGNALPSWAIDPMVGISTRPGASSIWDKVDGSKPLYCAGLRVNGQGPQWACRRPTRRTLSLAGVRLDHICEITNIANLEKYNMEPNACPGVFRTGLPLTINRYFYTEDAIDAFWRTLVCDCNYSERRRLLESELEIHGRAFRSMLNSSGAQNDLEAAKQNIRDGFGIGRLQSYGYTSSGHMAMFPYGSAAGDHICVFFGAETPHIVREIEDGGEQSSFKLIGPAYVHGWMDREVFQWLEEGRLKEERFTIV